MNEKDKKIIWVCVFFGLLAIIGFLIYNNYQSNKILDFNGVKISQKNYYTINEAFGEENFAYLVCNIEEGNCIQFLNRENYQKVLEKYNG